MCSIFIVYLFFLLKNSISDLATVVLHVDVVTTEIERNSSHFLLPETQSAQASLDPRLKGPDFILHPGENSQEYIGCKFFHPWDQNIRACILSSLAGNTLL